MQPVSAVLGAYAHGLLPPIPPTASDVHAAGARRRARPDRRVLMDRIAVPGSHQFFNLSLQSNETHMLVLLAHEGCSRLGLMIYTNPTYPTSSQLLLALIIDNLPELPTAA